MSMTSKSSVVQAVAAFTVLLTFTACGNAGGGSSVTPPAALAVVSSTPLTDAIEIPVDDPSSATFNMAMDPATITSSTFTLTSETGAAPVQGVVTYTNSTATFLPSADLENESWYAASITAEVRSASGERLQDHRNWRFKTGGQSAAPRVMSTTPIAGATGVLLTAGASATFSQAMDPATIGASTFTLTSGTSAVPVQGTVSYANSRAVFVPTAPLESNGSYTATITTGAKNLAGVALKQAFGWTFTTRNTSPSSHSVNLGTAGNFVILAKSGISTVPNSAITGNIGVSPISSTAVTGFSLIADATNVFSTSTQVTGKVYAADYASPTPSNLTTAVSDMETAFTDAAGRAATVTELGAGNIGGLTLAPGVYKWGTGLLIPTDVTLNGSATDVWIFQIAQDLTLSSATKVVLAGGALPKNVFWQVSGQAILGTTAHLEGVVLSQTAISLATGASINGRLLAQTAVTLDGSTVVEPAP
jgi:Ice-binding-like/Bacterial Ig-like domain